MASDAESSGAATGDAGMRHVKGLLMKKFALGAVALLALAAPAIAADLAPRTAYVKAPAYEPTYNWSGFYLGANAGGGWSHSSASTTTLDPSLLYFGNSSTVAIAGVGAQGLSSSGFTGGLTLGYNWQSGDAVVGIESDFDYFGNKGSASGTAVYPCCAPSTFTVNSAVSTDWLFTLRPRVGLASSNWLFYVTGGLALTQLKGNFSFTDTFASATESGAFSRTRAGWTIGGGAEYALLNGWSVKAEYLYVDFGSVATTSNNLSALLYGIPSVISVQTFTHAADLHSNIVRAGLNYKFGEPVVAKY